MLDNHHLQLAILTLLTTGSALVRVGRSGELREAAEARWREVMDNSSRAMPIRYRVVLTLDKVLGVAFAACALVSGLSLFDLLCN